MREDPNLSTELGKQNPRSILLSNNNRVFLRVLVLTHTINTFQLFLVNFLRTFFCSCFTLWVHLFNQKIRSLWLIKVSQIGVLKQAMITLRGMAEHIISNILLYCALFDKKKNRKLANIRPSLGAH